MQKKLWIGILLTICLILTGCKQAVEQTTPTTPTPEAAGKIVTITSFKFNPDVITVKEGETITWKQNDNAPHTVKFDDSESDPLDKGDTYSLTFNDAGEYSYICGIHPSMKGKVVVTK